MTDEPFDRDTFHRQQIEIVDIWKEQFGAQHEFYTAGDLIALLRRVPEDTPVRIAEHVRITAGAEDWPQEPVIAYAAVPTTLIDIEGGKDVVDRQGRRSVMAVAVPAIELGAVIAAEDGTLPLPEASEAAPVYRDDEDLEDEPVEDVLDTITRLIQEAGAAGVTGIGLGTRLAGRVPRTTVHAALGRMVRGGLVVQHVERGPYFWKGPDA